MGDMVKLGRSRNWVGAGEFRSLYLLYLEVSRSSQIR